MPRINQVIKEEIQQTELRRSPSLVEDRLDDLKTYGEALIEAATQGGYSVEYVDNVAAQFDYALKAVVKFGSNAVRMVMEDRELRRDAVAELDSATRQVTGLLALVDILQTNHATDKQQAVREATEQAIRKAVEELAAAYDADPDELLAVLQKRQADSR